MAPAPRSRQQVNKENKRPQVSPPVAQLNKRRRALASPRVSSPRRSPLGLRNQNIGLASNTLAQTWELKESLGPKTEPWACCVATNPAYPNFNITGDQLLFGRLTSCDVRVNDPMVSGEHCRVYKHKRADSHAPEVFVEDNSTNGTFIDSCEKRLRKAEKATVSSGTEIILIPKGPSREKVSFIVYILQEEKNEKAPEGDVTFVFTDVQGSTKLWEGCKESMDVALKKHDFLLRKVLIKHKGYEVKTEGDAFMVAFFNTVDAIQWCIACQKQLMEVEWPKTLLQHPCAKQESHVEDGVTAPLFKGIRVRMGIHVGRPVCRRNPVHKRMDYFGPVVNLSARISDSAHGGQIVCTKDVIKQLEQHQDDLHEHVDLSDLGMYQYKGIKQATRVFQIAPRTLTQRRFPFLRTPQAPTDDSPQEDGGVFFRLKEP